MIFAVKNSVTLEAAMDTRAVSALKLICFTGSAVDLIGVVITVWAVVTLPDPVNALAVVALELVWSTWLWFNWLYPNTGVRPLVRAIAAVHVPVTAPQLGDTHGVVALEGVGATGGFWTGELV